MNFVLTLILLGIGYVILINMGIWPTVCYAGLVAWIASSGGGGGRGRW